MAAFLNLVEMDQLGYARSAQSRAGLESSGKTLTATGWRRLCIEIPEFPQFSNRDGGQKARVRHQVI